MRYFERLSASIVIWTSFGGELKRDRVDWVAICSPNYLHDSHIRLALRNGAHALCEKPIVINPWNLDALQQLEVKRSDESSRSCSFASIRS